MRLLHFIAVGDAYGAAHEFNTKEFRDKHNDLRYYNRQGNLVENGNPVFGIYTDDTQMSLAIASLLTSGNFAHERVMAAFQKQYKDDPRAGYSKRVTELMNAVGPYAALDNVKPRDTNGCIMRALPLGLIKDVEKLKVAAVMTCSVTHPTIKCIQSTVFLALFSHYLAYGIGGHVVYDIQWRNKFHAWIEQHMGINYGSYLMNYNTKGEITSDVTETLAFVYQVFYAYDNMQTTLTYCIQTGGDTDSTASISMGLAHLGKKVDNLPEELHNNLENGKWGKIYIDSIDRWLTKYHEGTMQKHTPIPTDNEVVLMSSVILKLMEQYPTMTSYEIIKLIKQRQNKL